MANVLCNKNVYLQLVIGYYTNAVADHVNKVITGQLLSDFVYKNKHQQQ